MFRRILTPVVRESMRANIGLPMVSTRFASKAPAIQVSMDDLPVPQGSWETQYKANQARYNMHLAIGILLTVASIVTAKASGLVYLNAHPPPYPKDS